MGIRIPLTAAYHAEGVRIATPACGMVRNDRFFDKRYGAFRRRGEGTPPYAWVEGAVCGRRRGVGEIGEAPPAADEASRFRGSAPIGGHDSGRESAGTTVGNRRPLRGTGSAVRGVYGLPRRSADWFAMTFLEGRVICGARPAGGGGLLCAGWGDLFSIYTQILFFACYN